MKYIIGIGGLIGTGMLAYALFGMEFVFPRWKRWAVGLIGAGLAATFWIVRPVWWQNDGSYVEQDCWDGRSNSCPG